MTKQNQSQDSILETPIKKQNSDALRGCGEPVYMGFELWGSCGYENKLGLRLCPSCQAKRGVR